MQKNVKKKHRKVGKKARAQKAKRLMKVIRKRRKSVARKR